jgi:hypothetical protein
MKKILLAATICLMSVNAIALKAIENGNAWNKAKSSERDALVRKIMIQTKDNSPASKLRDCVDSFYGSQEPAKNLEREIISVMLQCQGKLPSRG